MKYSIEFYYRATDDPRPYHCVQDTPIESDSAIPVPSAGDVVSYQENDDYIFRKVESVNWIYSTTTSEPHIRAMVTTTDVSGEEMNKRMSKY